MGKSLCRFQTMLAAGRERRCGLRGVEGAGLTTATMTQAEELYEW